MLCGKQACKAQPHATYAAMGHRRDQKVHRNAVATTLIDRGSCCLNIIERYYRQD